MTRPASTPFPPRDGPAEREARERRSDLEERWIDEALSAVELEELDRSRAFEREVVNLIRRAERSPAFAAAVRRHADGGSVWLGFTRAPDLLRRRALADFPWPDRVFAYRAERPATELDVLLRRIAARREELAGLGVRLTACSVDQEANVVRVWVLAAGVERARQALADDADAVRVAAGRYGRRQRSEPRA